MIENDRELLMLAATAAREDLAPEHWEFWDADDEAFWNPLADNGEAIVLAEKCKLSLLFSHDCYAVTAVIDGHIMRIDAEEMTMQAMRRAIVIAAAMMGKRTQIPMVSP
ncbi:hypothetical protein ACI2KR_06480 [Pseudomonas luteola]